MYIYRCVNRKIELDKKIFVVYCYLNGYVQEERVVMDIQIITTSDVALYEQIATQIKKLIINGSLQEGDPLPSVRALAQE